MESLKKLYRNNRLFCYIFPFWFVFSILNIYYIFLFFHVSLKSFKNIKFEKLEILLYVSGIISGILNFDISILIMLTLVFVIRNSKIDFNCRFYKIIVTIVFLIALILNLMNYRPDLYDPNFMSIKMLYLLLGINSGLFFLIYSGSIILTYISRGSFLGLFSFIFIKIIKINSTYFNIFMIFFILLIQIFTSFYLDHNFFEDTYLETPDRLFYFFDNSALSRLKQYSAFYNGVDISCLLTNCGMVMRDIILEDMIPHNSFITTLASGGVFLLIFSYGITAFYTSPIIFIPILISSTFLHNSFMPVYIILAQRLYDITELKKSLRINNY